MKMYYVYLPLPMAIMEIIFHLMFLVDPLLDMVYLASSPFYDPSLKWLMLAFLILCGLFYFLVAMCEEGSFCAKIMLFFAYYFRVAYTLIEPARTSSTGGSYGAATAAQGKAWHEANTAVDEERDYVYLQATILSIWFEDIPLLGLQMINNILIGSTLTYVQILSPISSFMSATYNLNALYMSRRTYYKENGCKDVCNCRIFWLIVFPWLFVCGFGIFVLASTVEGHDESDYPLWGSENYDPMVMEVK